MGIFNRKPKVEKPNPAQAFETFKSEVKDAVSRAKKCGIWDSNLGDFLSRYGAVLGGGR